MSDKYVIKNCPNLSHAIMADGTERHFQCGLEIDKYCQDCTDCVMKQIVDKCKKEIRVYRDTLLPNDGTNTLHFGRQSFAYDILQMLDIEEINPKIKRSECPYGGIDCAWCTEECE